MIRLLRQTSRLRRDERGIATIEFALWATLFFTAMLGGLDFALWRTYELRLDAALSQGEMLIFNNRENINTTYAGQIESYVRAAADLPGPANRFNVTVRCNGTGTCAPAATRQCACLNTATPAAYVTTTCGNACAARPNTTARGYATIEASYTYVPVVLPRGLLANRPLVKRQTLPL